MSRARVAAVLALGLAAACAPFERGPERYPSLARAYAARFPVGVAVEPRHLEGMEGRFVAWHFTSLVAENAMKPPALQPREGQFDFTGADRIVDFAVRHGMKVRGHTLLWHEQTPDWIWRGPDGGPASRELVRERLRNHIATVVGRYRGRVQAWDVVNEVIDPAREDCLRADRWRETLGPDYVEWAFRFAHEADPSARLFINDFYTTQPARRRCLARVVEGLIARGVPVHGIGHQMHVDIANPAPAEVDEAFAQFARLGLENQVTEMDMSFHDAMRKRYPGSDAELLARQALSYQALFAVFRARPDVTSVTFWGLSDGHSWLDAGALSARGDRPLLFDARLEPKPAFWSVIQAAGGGGAAPAGVVSQSPPISR